MNLSYLSASRIGTFEQCELKYHAKYELKLKERVHPLTIMGSALHKVFEKATLARLSGDGDERGEPRFWMNECCTNYGLSSEHRMLLGELSNNAVQWGYFRRVAFTKGCEVPFAFELEDGTKVKGFIDRLDIEPPCADVVDLKTQKSQMDDAALKGNWQARVYNIAARHLYPDVSGSVTVSFWVLRHRVQRVWMSAEDARQDRVSLMRVAEKIRSCKEPRANPSALCRWCPLFGECEYAAA